MRRFNPYFFILSFYLTNFIFLKYPKSLKFYLLSKHLYSLLYYFMWLMHYNLYTDHILLKVTFPKTSSVPTKLLKFSVKYPLPLRPLALILP
jgi:hypothetical protein